MVTIRTMTEADVPAIAAIERATFSMPWSPDDFRMMIAEKDKTYLVVELDGTVIGGAGLHNIVGDGEITNVAIMEAYRGHGYATLLLTELLRVGREMGVTAFTLEVRAGNAPAIRLYERMGFVSEGIRPRFYERPVEDAVIYWMRG